MLLGMPGAEKFGLIIDCNQKTLTFPNGKRMSYHGVTCRTSKCNPQQVTNNRIRVEPVLLQSPKLQTVLLPGQEIELRPHTGNLPDGEYAIEPSMNCKASSNALTWLQPNILEVKGPPSTEFFGRVSSGLPKLSPSNTGGGSRKDPSMLRHLRFQQRPKRKRNTNPPHRLTYARKFKQTITKHQSKDTSSEEES